MMVVGLFFLIGGVGVLLTMNRLLWPLSESAPAGGPGQPGRTPVAGGRPGSARHPRERAATRSSTDRPQRQAQPTEPAPPPSGQRARKADRRTTPPPPARRARAAEPEHKTPPPGRRASAAEAELRTPPPGRRARAAEVERTTPPPGRRRRAAEPERAVTPPPTKQQRGAPAQQPPSRARVRVVTVPDPAPARGAAGGRVYGGDRRA
ncbi:hypothetical protein Ais01nite_27290 [Asanoa ishikariensis]|uniref:hypothetical protein n=1 Tax=Asanoa ishikariensis TaxID=137265 RepID=UPI000B80C93E|nr:hypothetical protein [Asanoa ishikariensis]GIF64694.1 hypothetical protein Ais01nite_27290 [Asanoa ishikariensis]